MRSARTAAVLYACIAEACVGAIERDPATAPHFERCFTHELEGDLRDGRRDRDESSIRALCTARARDMAEADEARARSDESEARAARDPADDRSPEQIELERLRRSYDSCDDWPRGTDAEVAICQAEINQRIVAAKGRHEMRRIADLDREQRERHHREVMTAMDPAETPTPAATGSATAQPSTPPESSAARQARAAAVAKVAPPWWCYEGSLGSFPTGSCTKTAEACKREADGFAKGDQAKIIRSCAAQPLAACVGATKVLQATHQVDCFATFVGCEAVRAQLQSGVDYSGVTECEATPTSWVSEPSTAPSPF